MAEPAFSILPAQRADVPHMLEMISELAAYENLAHLLEVTADRLEHGLFGARPAAEALLLWAHRGDCRIPAGFALFFHNYSTFLGKSGLWLEDLFVKPAWRKRGFGRALLQQVARIAVERQCGRFEWAVLDWNEPAIRFYESVGATIMPEWQITRVTGAALRALGKSLQP